MPDLSVFGPKPISIIDEDRNQSNSSLLAPKPHDWYSGPSNLCRGPRGGYGDSDNGWYDDSNSNVHNEGTWASGEQYYTNTYESGLAEEPGASVYATAAPGPGSDGNTLWIVSPYNPMNRILKLKIPSSRYGKVVAIPLYSGRMVLHERKPNGQVTNYQFSNVQSGSTYQIYFISESPGIYIWAYTVNGHNSNEVQFWVIGSGGGSGSCLVWTNKSSYGIGETVIVRYYVSTGTTAHLTVTKPNGVVVEFGSNLIPAGTRTRSLYAGYPLGRRTVVFETSNGCRDICYFDVVK